MATGRDIVSRALKKLRIIDATEQPSAEDARDGLGELNDALFQLAAEGCPVLQDGLTLAGDVALFIPPEIDRTDRLAEERMADALLGIAYRGSWDAADNSPPLSPAAGTAGHTYQVAIAGTTALDGGSAWAVGDWIIYDGLAWLKGQSSERFHGLLASLLAIRLAPLYGRDPSVVTVQEAREGKSLLMAQFSFPGRVQFRNELLVASRRGRYGVW